MKRSLATVTLVILALTVPLHMLAQGSKAEQEVRATFDETQKAYQMRGAEAAAFLDKYLVDDYMRITPDGKVFTKAEWLDSYRTGKTRYESVEVSDLKTRVYGRTAVITGITRAKGIQVGVPTGTGSRFTRVFVKRNGVWQIVQYQTTRIAQ